MLPKTYQNWHKQKILVNQKARPFCKVREVWMAYVGENIGHEQDGKGEQYLRPVLIVKKFNKDSVWIIPLTTSIKENSPFFHSFIIKKNIYNTTILSQLRLIDCKRLLYRMDLITKDNIVIIKEKLRFLLT